MYIVSRPVTGSRTDGANTPQAYWVAGSKWSPERSEATVFTSHASARMQAEVLQPPVWSIIGIAKR